MLYEILKKKHLLRRFTVNIDNKSNTDLNKNNIFNLILKGLKDEKYSLMELKTGCL